MILKKKDKQKKKGKGWNKAYNKENDMRGKKKKEEGNYIANCEKVRGKIDSRSSSFAVFSVLCAGRLKFIQERGGAGGIQKLRFVKRSSA